MIGLLAQLSRRDDDGLGQKGVCVGAHVYIYITGIEGVFIHNVRLLADEFILYVSGTCEPESSEKWACQTQTVIYHNCRQQRNALLHKTIPSENCGPRCRYGYRASFITIAVPWKICGFPEGFAGCGSADC